MSGSGTQGQSFKPLYRVFSSITRHYDLINQVITLGMHRGWRKKAASVCLSSYPSKILDICCGTGDMVISISKMAEYSPEIIGVDYSQPMLEMAKKKATLLGENRRIEFVNAEISQLPFPDSYFDCLGIAFAFRNLTYENPLAKLHIKEVLRVLRPGGKCVIVESSQPNLSIIRNLNHLYLRWFVYPAGFIISGNKSAYRYLAESAENFFSAEEARDYLLNSGFGHVAFERLIFGAAAIYTAIK